MNLYKIYEDKILYKRIECISVFHTKGVKIVEGSDLPSSQCRHMMLYSHTIPYSVYTTKKQRNAKYIGSEFRDFGFLSNDIDISITHYILCIYTHMMVNIRKQKTPTVQHILKVSVEMKKKKPCRTEIKTESIRMRRLGN